MRNPLAIPVTVDGMEFAITWHDYGSFMKLRVFQNDKLLGHKNFPIATDQGQGVVAYAVRSILKGNQNGLSEKTVEA
jgi:hypothetical protein